MESRELPLMPSHNGNEDVLSYVVRTVEEEGELLFYVVVKQGTEGK